jgi:xanthine dehydrogenase accessory factor
LDSLYHDIVRFLDAGAPFALGTVVHTTGSTPQKTGARAVFLPDGNLLGTLGGGCMEAEARQRGVRMAHGGGVPELMELHLDDDFGWDDGLICGGTANILLQPRPTEEQQIVFRAVRQLHEERVRGVLALLVSGPEGVSGAMTLVRANGESVGTVGDAALQSAVEETARGLLLEGREEPRRIVLREQGATLYFEPLLPKPVCFIAGAGHVGAALCHYAARVGFEVAIVDDRPSLCNEERLPDATHVLAADIVQTVRDWPKTPDTYFVIVTRGHKHDAVVLREVIHAPVAYLGMIGSKRKILTIYEEFLAEGLATREELARVHAPIGLDIGALAVEEIALCIAAELVMIRRQGAGREGANDGSGTRQRDCAGGGREPSDGDAEAALAVRATQRDSDGRSLAASLPARRRAGGAGASSGGDRG